MLFLYATVTTLLCKSFRLLAHSQTKLHCIKVENWMCVEAWFSQIRCHSDIDACFPGYRVSRTHIPRDACFPAHISLFYSHSDIHMFPRGFCFSATIVQNPADLQRSQSG